jgi:hypothetical protein
MEIQTIIPNSDRQEFRTGRFLFHIHEGVDDILDYLTTPTLARGGITKISGGTSIPESALRIGALLECPARTDTDSLRANHAHKH